MWNCKLIKILKQTSDIPDFYTGLYDSLVETVPKDI